MAINSLKAVFTPNPLQPSDGVRRQKNISEDLSRSVLSQFKTHHPSGNLKFNNLDILQTLKLRNLEEKSFKFLLGF